jgi:hypothetical protein
MDDPAISLVTGLTGAVIGAGSTLLAGSFQHKRDQQARIEQERRERQMAAAEKCAQLFNAMELAVQDRSRVRPSELDQQAIADAVLSDQPVPDGLIPDPEPSKRVWTIAQDLYAAALDLSPNLRQRVELATDILFWTEDLRKIHYLEDVDIAWHVRRIIREDIANFIAREPLPHPHYLMMELEVSHRALMADREVQYEDEIEQKKGGRERFLKRLPAKVRQSIEEAEQQRPSDNPREPAEIASLHTQASQAKHRRMTLVTVCGLLAALAIIVGIIATALTEPQPAPVLHVALAPGADSASMLLVHGRFPANQRITLTITTGTGQTTAPTSVLTVAAADGTLRDAIPVPVAPTYTVTAAWTDATGGWTLTTTLNAADLDHPRPPLTP